VTTRKVKSKMGWVDNDGIIWVSNLLLITYYLTSCFGLQGGPSGSAMALPMVGSLVRASLFSLVGFYLR
jgi:hypothetical protein